MEVIPFEDGVDPVLSWPQLLGCGVTLCLLAMLLLGCCTAFKWCLARCSTREDNKMTPERCQGYRQWQGQDQGTQTTVHPTWEHCSREGSPVRDHQMRQCQTPTKKSHLTLRAMAARASPVMRDIEKREIQGLDIGNKGWQITESHQEMFESGHGLIYKTLHMHHNLSPEGNGKQGQNSDHAR